MNNAIINIKTDAKTKREAQKLAEQFGVSLSSLITMNLRQLIRTKKLNLDLITEAEPSASELDAIKKGLAEFKRGDLVSLDEV